MTESSTPNFAANWPAYSARACSRRRDVSPDTISAIGGRIQRTKLKKAPRDATPKTRLVTAIGLIGLYVSDGSSESEKALEEYGLCVLIVENCLGRDVPPLSPTNCFGYYAHGRGKFRPIRSTCNGWGSYSGVKTGVPLLAPFSIRTLKPPGC